ncbi:hypothetical protein T492DRAFT_835275 [Pavlovales sp. CCMP2436]|nr:hypothetical protein T492DRAFT_835275 [Pavlovales sp. CCMP2436]|mmetsp:Transcript_20151/g.47348  ORF Transcript_20151/g.47348 Transcript_20151/m.47348 type:complete len:290 (+) Transcript_20151:52-921(+)
MSGLAAELPESTGLPDSSGTLLDSRQPSGLPDSTGPPDSSDTLPDSTGLPDLLLANSRTPDPRTIFSRAPSCDHANALSGEVSVDGGGGVGGVGGGGTAVAPPALGMQPSPSRVPTPLAALAAAAAALLPLSGLKIGAGFASVGFSSDPAPSGLPDASPGSAVTPGTAQALSLRNGCWVPHDALAHKETAAGFSMAAGFSSTASAKSDTPRPGYAGFLNPAAMLNPALQRVPLPPLPGREVPLLPRAPLPPLPSVLAAGPGGVWPASVTGKPGATGARGGGEDDDGIVE